MSSVSGASSAGGLVAALGSECSDVKTIHTTGKTNSAIVIHPAVQLVSITGGPRTAQLIAGEAGPKLLPMELGGNCPVLVCDDAALKDAAAAVVAGSFGCAGQNCVSVQRVLVTSTVHDEFLDLLQETASGLRVGSKASTSTDVGPLIIRDAAMRVEEWVTEARDAGAKLTQAKITAIKLAVPHRR